MLMKSNFYRPTFIMRISDIQTVDPGECHSNKGFSPPPSTTGDVRLIEGQVVHEKSVAPEGVVKNDAHVLAGYEKGSQGEANIPQLRRTQRNRRPPISYEAQ